MMRSFCLLRSSLRTPCRLFSTTRCLGEATEAPTEAPTEESTEEIVDDGMIRAMKRNRMRPVGKRAVLRASFARGGTSKGLVVFQECLPLRHHWPRILPALMGSPDSYGRQLNGMGSGISSTSKICILSRPENPDVSDVDYTFVQVGIKDGKLDFAGNCGNMSSVVGPVAWDTARWSTRRMESKAADKKNPPEEKTLRLLNTNTGKLIHSTFAIGGDQLRYNPEGGFYMDGVSEPGSRIDLKFLKPGGAATGRTLPTGNAVDTLRLPDGSTIEASLVDVSNPGVFVRVSDLGIADPTSLDPAAVMADTALQTRLEQIRRAGASAMGLDPEIESIPKIVLLFPEAAARESRGVNVKCLAMSMGQAHRAVPLTLALCLGAAARLEGTIPSQIAVGLQREGDAVVIGHPGGKIEVKACVEGGEVLSVQAWRTARVLMMGDAFY